MHQEKPRTESVPKRKASSGHKHARSKPMGNGRFMLYILLGLTTCIAAFMFMLYPAIKAGPDIEVSVKIPAGATPESVSDTLSKYYGKDFAKRVMRLSKFRGVAIHTRHGMYTLPAGSSAFAVARRLTSGGQTPVRITINGFRDMPRMIELISRKMEFPVDSLRAAIADPALLARYGLTPENAMALFMDNTYEIYWTASARDLVRKIGENYEYFWNEVRVESAKELGLTPAEMMVVASITDEETNDIREKGAIGRLYINRLKTGMRLQADPTVRFAMGNFTIQRISHKDLQYDSPYNTYRISGLPPGPIRTTSEATIMEILNSEPHNYLYMCAKEDFSGRHNFATTYSEHLQNAERYQEALDQRGIHF